MRWLGQIGMLLLVLAAGVVTWLAVGNDSTDAPRRGAPPAPEANAAPAEAPAGNEPTTQESAPRRRHAKTAGDGDHRVVDPGPPTGIFGVVMEELDDGGVAPFGGAAVQLFVDGGDLADAPDALTIDIARPVAETTSGADGHFRLDVTGGAPWRVRVTTADGRATHARGVGPEDAGELYLHALETARVVVTDEEGRRLEGAYAYLYTATFDTIPYGVARAGADGSIVLDPAPGNVVVTAPGHGFAEATNPEGDVEVTLPRGLDLAGIVVDDTDAPLADLQLSIDDNGPERTLRTDADGRFRFERVGQQDEVWMSVHLEDRNVSRVLAYGDESARVVIPRRGDIAGVAVFADGSPAAGALVEDVTVDEEGHFELWTDGRDHAVNVVGRVMGTVEGFGREISTHVGSQRVELRPGQTVDVRLVLSESPHSFLAVRAVSPEGRAVRDATVYVGGVWSAVQRIPGHTLVVVGVEPGTEMQVRIGDTARRYAPVAETLVTTAAWDVSPIDMHLGAVEPVTLRAFAPDGKEIPRSDWTRVHVEGGELLPDGRIQAQTGAYVRIVLEAGGERFDRRLQLPFEEPFELHVRFPPTAGVVGRLVRGDGTPGRDLDIVVVPFSEMGSGAYPRTVPRADGSFAIAGVPSGRALFVVWQSAGEVQAQRRLIDVPESGELDLGELLAWDDVMLEGRVTVPRGASAAGLAIEVHWDEGRESAQAISRNDGSFAVRVPGVPDALVVARRAHRLFGLKAVDLTSTRRVDVRVSRVGRVRLTAPEAWTQESFDVYIVGPGGKGAWAPGCDWIDRGRVVIVEEVPSGAWTLRLVPRNGDPVERTVRVAPGEETIVHFDR